jgi:hypothetical protein
MNPWHHPGHTAPYKIQPTPHPAKLMQDLSWKDAIVSTLQEAGQPMHYAEIADAIAERQLRSDLGATPANSVNTTINLSMRKDGATSPFVQIKRGEYSLRSVSGEGAQVARQMPSGTEGVATRELGGAGEIQETGLINAFGMYWSREQVNWAPSTPKLLGHQQTGSSPVDFCEQKGVYLLHDGRSVVYVGRSTDQPLGVRLRQHTSDRLNGRWDRFSWFGIYPISENGTLLKNSSTQYGIDMLIVTMEALLIEGLEPPQNRKRGDDFRAAEFQQTEDPEIGKARIRLLLEEIQRKM